MRVGDVRGKVISGQIRRVDAGGDGERGDRENGIVGRKERRLSETVKSARVHGESFDRGSGEDPFGNRRSEVDRFEIQISDCRAVQYRIVRGEVDSSVGALMRKSQLTDGGIVEGVFAEKQMRRVEAKSASGQSGEHQTVHGEIVMKGLEDQSVVGDIRPGVIDIDFG